MPSRSISLALNSVVNQKAFSNSCGLPLAVTVDFDPPELAGVARLNRGGARCSECGAFLNQHCKFNAEGGSWKCAMCGTANLVRLANPEAPLSAYPELCRDAVEYTPPTPAAQQGDAVVAAHEPTPGVAPHVVVVIDANLELQALANLRAALPAALQASLSPDTLVSVVGVDSVVTLWQLAAAVESGAGSIAADTMSGDSAMGQARVAQVSQQHARYCMLTGHPSAGKVLGATLGALRPLHTHTHVRERPRCLAAGIEVAMRIMAAAARASMSSTSNGAAAATPQAAAMAAGVRPVPKLPPSSRVLVITGGPCTIGPGSVPHEVLDHLGLKPPVDGFARIMEDARTHVDSLASMAQALQVPIDIMAAGVPPRVNVALLSQLCEASGGTLWSHDAAASLLLQQALQASLSRCWGTQGILDIYMSDGLKLSQWLGPVSELKDLKNTAKGVLAVSPVACSVGALCDGQGAMARLELTRDLKDTEAVFLQVVVQYYDVLSQQRIVRVVTRRLRVVSTIAEMLRGLDPVAAAVEMAKRLVMEAVSANAHRHPPALAAARASCAAAMSLLASRFGKAQSSRSMLGLGGRRMQLLPDSLVFIVQSLYMLQLGHLLGEPQDIHPEARLLLMRAFLTSNTATAAAIVNPALYVLRPAPAPGTPPKAAHVGGSPRHVQLYETPQKLKSASPGARSNSPFVLVQNDGTSVDSSQPAAQQPAFQAAVVGEHLQQHQARRQASSAAQRLSLDEDPYQLVPVPSADLVVAALQRMELGTLSEAPAGRQAVAGGTQIVSAAALSRPAAVVLDLGTRLLVWRDHAELQPAAGGGQQGLPPQAVQVQAQVINPLLSPDLPVQLLDRFPLPDLIAQQAGGAASTDGGIAAPAVASTEHLVVPLRMDTAPQQHTQLHDLVYSSAYWQYSRTAWDPSGSVVPDPRTQVPALLAAAAEAAQASNVGGGSHSGTKGQAASKSLLQWCTDLGVLLPSSS